ncbi:MAG: beta-ketoacyl-ACP synthase II [Bacteroidales bacterium]|nr:beta-ketoacyl-ACP synthase II [Bacteroidales bacterium]
MNLKRVVVTGLGSLTPIGNNVSDFWDALLKGVSGAGLVTHFDASNYKCHIAAEVKNFDSAIYFDRKEVRKLDLFTQYGMVVADEAIRDAGIDQAKINPDRIGVIFGTGMGGVQTFQNEVSAFAANPGNPRFSPFFITKTIGDICAGQISIKHGFRGPNYSTSAACASAAMAISDAFMFLRLGKADVIITGGSEAPVLESGIGGFASMQALSLRNDDPATASRPFDKDRDGFVLGEGAGALVLEELEHAKARGAKIYAELTGCGITADAYHIAASHPDGLGAMNAMRMAIEESGMQVTDVDHINTHGTSTPIGDISEPKAVVSLFGDHAGKITLNSTKSMTGHLLGAAGAVEAIATILALQNDIVPPTINHFTDDPNIPQLDFSFNKPTRRPIHFALSNTFGFGGHNACLAFRKY